MVSPFGAGAASFGSSLFGSGMFGGSGTSYRTQRKRGKKLLDAERKAMHGYFNQALAGILEGNKAREGGYTAALGEVGRMGGASRRSAVEAGQGAAAAGTSSLTSRGLGSSSMVQGMQGQVASQTSRSIAAINESLGQVYANLRIGQGQARAQGQAAVGGLALGRYEAEKGAYFDPWFNLLVGGGGQYQGPRNWSEIMGKMAGGMQGAGNTMQMQELINALG